MHIRQMTVGRDVERLMRAGVVRELPPSAKSRGRPQIPLGIDPLRRNVVGVSLKPGSVEVARSNLLGEPMGTSQAAEASTPRQMIAAAARLLRRAADAATLSIGIAAPGFVDPVHRAILFSAAFPSIGQVNLNPLYNGRVNVPRVLENDTHALAARWMLTNVQADSSDTLLVFLDDGQIGAALLIEGRPNRGCVGGANELGHTRLQVQTDRCYCGQIGCLERIFSSNHLSRLSGRPRKLSEALAAYSTEDRAVTEIIELLAAGLANAINFTRAGRVVLAGELCQHAAFFDSLAAEIRRRMLQALCERVELSTWHPQQVRSAQTAAWLALAGIYLDGWVAQTPERAAPRRLRGLPTTLPVARSDGCRRRTGESRRADAAAP